MVENAETECSFGNLLKSYRMVIPEIQREYVWGDAAIGRNVLGHFFRDFLEDLSRYEDWNARVRDKVALLREKFKDLEPSETMLLEHARKDLAKDHDEMPVSSVGFVYAYISGVRRNDDPGRTTANLIDGQQRFTTYFMMLLHIAYRANRFQEFLKLVRPPDGASGADPSFDFRVRVLTHEFLVVLINRIRDSRSPFSFSNLSDATWYLQEYRADVSIRSMTHALESWDSVWGDRTEDEASRCYDYLLGNVTFMFYRIEAIQGEQLYISMNGRGRNLSQPEIMRAKVFRDADAANIDARDVGRLFERINDFFWAHRIDNELTADAGEKKFFRWVFLLWKYDVMTSSGSTEEDRKAATTDFKRVLQTKTRTGKAVFDLDEDMFGSDAITFDLIQKTFDALEHLFDAKGSAPIGIAAGSDVKRKLLDYLPPVLECAEDTDAFQQHCFCLLPMLRFVMDDSNRTTESSLARQLALARYLHNLIRRSAIQKSVNDLVDKAMELADEFATRQGCWTEYLGSQNTQQIGRIMPEDEIAKANRLTHANQDSLSRLTELVWEVEDYKMGLNDNKGDSCIQPFLDTHATWRTDVWDAALYAEYSLSFARIRTFFGRLSTDRLHTTEWMMYPSHRGYRLRGSDKVSRFSDTDILESDSLIRHVIELESLMSQQGATPENVFDAEARSFLRKFWDRRTEATDAITLGALALLSSRIARAHRPGLPAYDASIANLQYLKKYYDDSADGDKYQNPGMIPIGGVNFSVFFWTREYSEKNWAWSYGKSCRSRLLACHQVSAADLDEWVRSFYGIE